MKKALTRKFFYSTLICMEAVILILAVVIALFIETPLLDELSRSLRLYPAAIALLTGLLLGFVPYLLAKLPLLHETYFNIVRALVGFRLTVWDCILISLLAGLCEEALFRGVLHDWWGIWLSSLLFVLIHGYWNPMDWRKMVFGAFVFGISLGAGWFYIHYGLVPAMVFHFAVDLTAYGLIMNLQRRSPQLLAG